MKRFLVFSLMMILSVCFLTFVFISFVGKDIEEPLNPYVMETLHNILFAGFWLSFVYTGYILSCAILHFNREIERAKILKSVDIIPIPEDLLLPVLYYGGITSLLYVLQSYTYSYTLW